MPSASAKQPQLFRIENPLSVRLGNEFFRALPTHAGVYFFYDRNDKLLYIGQSSDLKARIGSYRHVTPEKNSKRTLRLVHRIHRIEWKKCEKAEEAIELERVLLLEYHPPFNRAGVWQGPPWWLQIEANAEPGKLTLSLNREQIGTGPHPSAFRHVLGSLARCLYRQAWPSAPLSGYPRGIFDVAIPLTLSLPLADPLEAAVMLRSYIEADCVSLLSKLETLPLGITAGEQEYWQEEVERVRKHAARITKTRRPH